jgi:hypothetical protein
MRGEASSLVRRRSCPEGNHQVSGGLRGLTARMLQEYAAGTWGSRGRAHLALAGHDRHIVALMLVHLGRSDSEMVCRENWGFGEGLGCDVGAGRSFSGKDRSTRKEEIKGGRNR